MDQEYFEILKNIINEKLLSQGKMVIENPEMNLNPEQKIALQQIIAIRIKDSGLAIREALGHDQVFGMISNEEIKYIDELIEEYKMREEKVSQLS